MGSISFSGEPRLGLLDRGMSYIEMFSAGKAMEIMKMMVVTEPEADEKYLTRKKKTTPRLEPAGVTGFLSRNVIESNDLDQEGTTSRWYS